jgi:feruloyl esterase
MKLFLALLAPLTTLAATAGPGTCEKLSALAVAEGKVLAAQEVPAGAFQPPTGRGGAAQAAAYKSLPAFCRVSLQLAPSNDSDIRVEVWLPEANWPTRIVASRIEQGKVVRTRPLCP